MLGLGGVGLNALLAAVASGAREVIAIDLNDDKLALARSLGATASFNATSESAADEIHALHGGVDYAFEMAGSVKAMDLAYRITRRGGRRFPRVCLTPTTALRKRRCVQFGRAGAWAPSGWVIPSSKAFSSAGTAFSMSTFHCRVDQSP